MKLHRLICLTGLLLSTVGCCHTQCVSSDPCNPCGRMGGGGCCLTNWLHSKMACRNYGWSDSCCGGCSVCGGSSCGYSGDFAGTVGGGSSCGCGQSSGYAPSSTTPVGAPIDQPPIPIPSSAAPIPPRSNEPTPAPASSDSTTMQVPTNGQIQHVSMEEFQRLPGVVISGPQSSVPTLATPTLAPPALSTVSVPPKPAPVQQAQWVPAK